jgi:hypothetical protein
VGAAARRPRDIGAGVVATDPTRSRAARRLDALTIRATTKRSRISSRRSTPGAAQLDPATVKILEANLDGDRQGDRRVARALAADPANVYLNNHLADARQRKLALLRRATALVGQG